MSTRLLMGEMSSDAIACAEVQQGWKRVGHDSFIDNDGQLVRVVLTDETSLLGIRSDKMYVTHRFYYCRKSDLIVAIARAHRIAVETLRS